MRQPASVTGCLRVCVDDAPLGPESPPGPFPPPAGTTLHTSQELRTGEALRLMRDPEEDAPGLPGGAPRQREAVGDQACSRVPRVLGPRTQWGAEAPRAATEQSGSGLVPRAARGPWHSRSPRRAGVAAEGEEQGHVSDLTRTEPSA